MAEVREDDDDDDEIFVYMGGNQQVPDGIRRARIHISVKIVRARAFQRRWQLISVEFHDGVIIIEKAAFADCFSLKSAKLLGVETIKEYAFVNCQNLTNVEFGDKLETIERGGFSCTGVTNMRMPSVRTIEREAFGSCFGLSNVEFGDPLETLQMRTFSNCINLERIALPLRGDMIADGVFLCCHDLATVDLVGRIHKSIASLHLESWRNEMTGEINRINPTLFTTSGEEKTEAIQQWMALVIRQLDHFKHEHYNLLREATTLLELALWKANLADHDTGRLDREGVRLTRGSKKRARKEISVTSGASIVIKNVLPFLQMLE